MLLEAREEDTGVAFPLDEGVHGVTVGFDAGDDYRAVLVSQGFWGTDACRSSLDGLVVDSCSIIYGESYISDAVTVLGMVG